MKIKMSTLFLIEYIKLNKRKLISPILIPILFSHLIVIANINFLDLEVNEFYLSGIVMNWFIFIAIFSTWYLSYIFWKPELTQKCWEKYKTYPIDLGLVLFVKHLFLTVLIFIQALFLWGSGHLVVVFYCQTNEVCSYYPDLFISSITYTVFMIPALILSSFIILKFKKAQIIAAVSILLTLIHAVGRDQQVSVLNIWSWPYLHHINKFDLLGLITIFIIGIVLYCIFLVIKSKKENQ